MGIEKSILDIVKQHLNEKLADIEADYRNKVSQIERNYVADRYYTTREAATYLSVNEQQITKWVKAGQMTRYNFGNKMYRFRRSELDTFAAQNKEHEHEHEREEEESAPALPTLSITKSVFQKKKAQRSITF